MTTLGDIKGMLKADKIAEIIETLKTSDIAVLREILREVLETKNEFNISTPLTPDNIAPLIFRLQELSKHPDEIIRSLVLDISPHIEHRRTIDMLIERLRNEEKLQLCAKAAEHLIANIKQITDDRQIEALKSALFGSTGERAEIVLDVVSQLDNPKAIKDIFLEVKKHWCPIRFQYCPEDILPLDEYFVAHELTKREINRLRPVIDKAVGEIFPNLKSYYADRELRGDIKCKICRKIRSSKLGIYEISKRCNECRNPNPNVIWELGLAYGFGKPAILILKKNSKVISDLAGLDRIEYKSMLDLEIQLKAKIQGLRGIFF